MTSTETTATAADIAGRLDGPTVAARHARPIADEAGGLTLDTLPGRDLDPDELIDAMHRLTDKLRGSLPC